ncbi:hypothetical protein NQ315_017244 [Exocentrus adspersus]|uniref:SH3 domain-binding protein 5-like protein n=1 Tax=Exocentrus adspersus TaxID=1586481 RepID=A0AAV8VFD2_9CUCU|nr:hypothetical protein NQ315_017244 [Exocentrus adspersus]
MNENGEECELDPRIQIELEKLNSTTDEINKLEIDYDEANTTFRMLLNESTRRLKLLSKKLGSCIDKSRPYYELLDEAKKAQQECQDAAVLYKKAHGIHAAAKETVALAEQRFLTHQHEWQFDNAWQEMLNHATMKTGMLFKVMEAENQKAESEREHQRRARIYNDIDEKLKQLEEKLQKYISKSRSYFDEKALCQEQLNTQKNRIETIKKDINKAKNFYAETLKNLEQISNEIHMKRQGLKCGENDLLKRPREPGVGAELESTFTEEPTSGPSKQYLSLPDINVELERFDDCSINSVSGASCAESGSDQHEHFLGEELEANEENTSVSSTRPVEGKSEDVFVSEFHLGKLLK